MKSLGRFMLALLFALQLMPAVRAQHEGPLELKEAGEIPAPAPRSAELKIPGGSIFLRDIRFPTRSAEFGDLLPVLTFEVVNRSTAPWGTLHIRFDIEATCSGEQLKLNTVVFTDIEWAQGKEISRSARGVLPKAPATMEHCSVTALRPSLSFAANSHYIVDADTGTTRDLDAERKEAAELAREADELARKEEATRAAERARAEKQAAQLAAETRKAREAEILRQRTECREVYKQTADKKISELTVKESHNIRVCEARGMYRPS